MDNIYANPELVKIIKIVGLIMLFFLVAKRIKILLKNRKGKDLNEKKQN